MKRFIFPKIVFFIIAIFIVFHQNLVSADSGLVGYWKFDEGTGTTAIDSSGFGDTGALSGPTYSTDVPQPGFPDTNSLSFSGADYVDVPYNARLDLGNTFTLAVWTKAISLDNQYSFLISRDGDVGASYDLGFKNNNPYVAINDGTGWSEYVATGYSFPTGSWHQVTAVRYGDNSLQIFVDGTSVATFNNVKIPQSVAGLDLTIGKRSQASGDSYLYNGLIDDVRVYDTALSGSEVFNLYSAPPVSLITSLDLGGYPVPYFGETPPSSITSNSSDYTVTGISWSPTDNPFQSNTQYTATITVTAAPDYAFPSEGVPIYNISMNSTGSAAYGNEMVSGTESGNSLSFTATYPTSSESVLDYAPGSGGTLTGDLSQIVNNGSSGTAVSAVPNSGYEFINWSDGSTQNPRTDNGVTEDISVTANFALISNSNSDATLSSSSTIKGEAVTNLGTPNSVLDSASFGSISLSLAQASDITNNGSYITDFIPNNEDAVITKVVKYSTAASSDNFATDTAYNGTDSVYQGDYFVIKVTAQNGSILYYRIRVNMTNDDVPSNIGPSDVINGGDTINTQPTFTFDLTDPNPNLQEKYWFVLANQMYTSNGKVQPVSLDSTIIDYESGLSSQGQQVFTVGQAPGNGVYIKGKGAQGQVLPPGVYYWTIAELNSQDAGGQFIPTWGNTYSFTVTKPSFVGTSTGRVAPWETPTGQIIQSPSVSPTVTTSVSISKYHFTRTLKQGMKGDDVVTLQTFLKVTPVPSKLFGPKTKTALKLFQKLHQLTPDGVAGPKTEKLIESLM